MFAGLMTLVTIANITPTPSAPMRYKIDVKSSQEMTMAGAKQSMDVTSSAWVTVTMVDSASGQAARVMIDSMTLVPTGMMAQGLPPEAASEAKGATIDLYLMGGKVQGKPKMSVQNPAIMLIFEGVNLLFAGNRAKLAVGDNWADTTRIDNTNDGGSQTGLVVTMWKVLSMDGDAYVLEGDATATMNAEQGGGAVNIATKTTGKQTVTTTGKGLVRKANVEAKVDATIIVSQMPDPIPMLGTTTLTITALP